MNKLEFEEVVDQLIQKNPHKTDKEKRLKEWELYRIQFYNKVDEFLNEYVSVGKIQCEEAEEKIYEDYIGEYKVKKLTITLGYKTASLVPIGTFLFGAKGRIDLKGSHGKIRFVLVDKKATSFNKEIPVRIKSNGEKIEREQTNPEITDWEWKISTNPPNTNYIDFKQDTFLSALLEVIGE